MFFQLFSDVSIFFFLILFKHRNRNASCVLDEPHINHHYLELSCRDARSNLQCLGPVSSDLWNFFLFGTIVKTFQLTETYVPDSFWFSGFYNNIFRWQRLSKRKLHYDYASHSDTLSSVIKHSTKSFFWFVSQTRLE